MSLRTLSLRRAVRWAPAALLVAVAACADNYPQTTLRPESDFARISDRLLMDTVWWALLVFVLVEGALVFAIWRFRARPDAAEPKQTHGNTAVEVVWTIIPAVILAMIAVPTVQAIFATSTTPTDALRIEVIGHQWWWEYRYPDLNIVTANELHVPVGKTVSLEMTTKDVLHSFWIPKFGGKRDVFPNRQNEIWFKAEVDGEYSGQCAEFCGVQHGRMGLRVIAQKAQEFQAWVASQQVGSPLVEGGAVTDSQLVALAGGQVPSDVFAKGQAAFLAGGCIACHAMSGTPMAGQMVLMGPNLSHVGSRTTIVAGLLPNTPENLTRWLRDPQAVKVGSFMRLPRPLTEEEISTLVAYLQAHK